MVNETNNRKIDLQFNKSVEAVEKWICSHPTTVKVVNVAAIVFGVGLMSAPLYLSSLAFIIPIAACGAILTLASTVLFLGLDILAPPHHNMKNHAYKPGQCENGRLYYDGDVPILALNSDNPYKAGKAHGYLCGDAISRLARRFDFVLHTLMKQPRGADVDRGELARLRQHIPSEYLTEMRGLLDGYNQWAKEHWWQFPKKLTLDDVLLFHLMPDSIHFHPQRRSEAPAQVKTKAPNLATVGCTSLVHGKNKDELVFARNMDWPSFGNAGTYSLVINRRYTDGRHNTAEVTVPGFVGTMTGINAKGLSLSMNVCAGSTKEIRGMPACFYNRKCLETYEHVEDVEKLSQELSPLGPYHLIVADKGGASSIHFYQSPEKQHVIRRWEKNKPLSTLNYCYSPEPSRELHHCAQRQAQIDRFMQTSSKGLEEALALPDVNNSITTHRVVMKPSTLTLQVAFDNSYAGKATLHSVTSTLQIF